MTFTQLSRFVQILLINGILYLLPLYSIHSIAAPTPEQLRMFQQLSPQQQQDALKAMQSNQTGGQQTQQTFQTAQPVTEPEVVQPRAVETDKK